MTRSHAFAVLMVAAQLTLVGFGAAGRSPLPARSILAGPLRVWGSLSGADQGYGFFAPSVSSDVRAVFEVVGRDGSSRLDRFATGRKETDIRLGNIVAMFFSTPEGLRDRLAASWAGSMFARHPGASRVVVRISAYELPPMAAYREGRRPEWRPAYLGTFTLDSSDAGHPTGPTPGDIR
jgi:hypothetical protein